MKKPISNDLPEVLKRELIVKNTYAYCKLLIDGKYVSETRKVSIEWPSFEICILDQFQIHMFTLPSKVELQIFIEDKMIDVVNVIIPGTHVKTLTSASRLIREYEFSKRGHFINERKKRGIDLTKEESLMTADEKSAAKRELPKLD